ncbi:MAG: biotin/lipoyl-containing protein, partial [Methanobacteriaceae archaeon]
EEEELIPVQKIEMEQEVNIPTEYSVEVDGDFFDVKIVPTGYMDIQDASASASPKVVEGAITSNMQGMILKLKVKSGDNVNEGDVIGVIEAMKMENDIQAETSGTVGEIFVEEGDTVAAGDPIMVIK